MKEITIMTNNIIYICNKAKNEAKKYCDSYTGDGAHQEFYKALYDAHCKVIEIFNSEETYEARYEKLSKFVNNRAKALQAKYKKTGNSDYFDAAYCIKTRILFI